MGRHYELSTYKVEDVVLCVNLHQKVPLMIELEW